MSVPVLPQPLREALETAGPGLEPDQVLPADPVLARQIIEESLFRYTLEELRLRESKAALFRALAELPDTPTAASAAGRG